MDRRIYDRSTQFSSGYEWRGCPTCGRCRWVRNDKSKVARCYSCGNKGKASGHRDGQRNKPRLKAIEEQITGLKRCNKCGEKYPANKDYFVLSPQSNGGVSSPCRKCKEDYFAAFRRNRGQLTWKEYGEIRFLTPVQRKIKARISHEIRNSLRSGKNGHQWETLVGYNVDQLISHLEKQFQPGMSWDNYGKWHIDHKIPVVAFNFNNPDDIDFKRCWELKNLQPLWAADNIQKGTTVDNPFQPALATI